jgi:hypothetical protein
MPRVPTAPAPTSRHRAVSEAGHVRVGGPSVLVGGAVVVAARGRNPRGTVGRVGEPQGAQSPVGSPVLAGGMLE